MRRRRPHISPALLGAIGAAALSFGVCFAVVADATRTSAPERVAVQPARQPVKASLALAPAPSLRVRASLLPPPAPPSRPVKAASEPPTQPTTTEQTSTEPTRTQEAPPTTTTTPTPKPKPKPKAKPKPKPKPSGPDFDDSGTQGPPSG